MHFGSNNKYFTIVDWPPVVSLHRLGIFFFNFHCQILDVILDDAILDDVILDDVILNDVILDVILESEQYDEIYDQLHQCISSLLDLWMLEIYYRSKTHCVGLSIGN